VTIITLEFCSLKVILLFFAQFDILRISIFATFAASRTVSALTAISKSSAKAIALVRFPNQD
jgi:hypothetical protein